MEENTEENMKELWVEVWRTGELKTKQKTQASDYTS